MYSVNSYVCINMHMYIVNNNKEEVMNLRGGERNMRRTGDGKGKEETIKKQCSSMKFLKNEFKPFSTAQGPRQDQSSSSFPSSFQTIPFKSWQD